MRIYFIKKYRVKYNQQFLSFNEAFAIGIIMFLISGFILSTYSIMFETTISPDTGELLLRHEEQKQIEKSLDPKIINDRIKQMQESFDHKSLTILESTLSFTFVGAVLSLIIAAICGKEKDVFVE